MPTADETKAALLAAFLKLLRERSVDAVSVRDVAAQAGVNHGLVHRYFGSKEALVREAVQRVSAAFHEAPLPKEGLSAWSFERLREHPEIPLILARACLDGPRDLLAAATPPAERLERFVAPLRQAIERLGISDAVDPYVLNAFTTAALLGWFVFGPLLAEGYKLPADADDALADILRGFDVLLGS